MLTFAVKRNYLSHNVVKTVEKVKANKKSPRYLPFDEWNKVKKIAPITFVNPRASVLSIVAGAIPSSPYSNGFRDGTRKQQRNDDRNVGRRIG